ncbi:hypothetical protein [uncultured Clostridium sp.]|uniref:hypothetical protein n=1 Tax=uncultured Clostridium sp. TaxID=59620 RepID=UPI00262FFF6A|nr:hypothetical protein [uncultured Clostridium sp.]
MLQQDQIINIKRNEGKGSANIVLGSTEAGKSTFLAGLGKSEGVFELLSERTSDGKGNLINAEINITDDPEIDENKLYIHGEICKKTVADIGDDNKFIGGILFSAIKGCYKNNIMDEKFLKERIQKEFMIAIKNPSNESLAYKIASFNDDEKKKIISSISEVSIENLANLYEEVMTIQKAKNKKGQYATNIFIEKIGTIKGLEDYINNFWSCVVECLNHGVEKFKQLLGEAKDITHIESEKDGKSEFYVILSGNDNEQRIKDILLKSENGSKEYLLSKLSLVFRGTDCVFENPKIDKDAFIVAEQNNRKIHVVRFIDTMGLFHEQGKETEDEYERILDILSEYHSEKVIFVISSDVNATTKNGYQAIREFLTKAKGNISVCLMFTKWDIFMQSRASEKVGQSKFVRREKVKVDWDGVFETCKLKQDELIKSFETAVLDNSNKNKPIIKSIIRYGLVSGNDYIDNYLEKEKIVYQDAISKLVYWLNYEDRANGDKIRIKVVDDKPYSLIIDSNKKINISALFNNLVAECKGKKLYASTVMACIRKWRLGIPHFSKVLANQYGYENIETRFVLELGNYAKQLSKDAIRIKPEILADIDNTIQLQEIISRKVSSSIGKKFATAVLEKSYRNGFLRDSHIYMTQYNRFSNQLQYTQDNYFNSAQITANKYIIESFEKAMEETVNDVINENCIVVY